MREFDLTLPGGRVLHAYDTGPTGSIDELVVAWHGGTPNTGEPPAPLLGDAARAGIRFVGADRPGYGGSSAASISVGDVAQDVAAVADAVGARRFATIGHSGGGPRALAVAALLPTRTVAAVAVAAPAPWPAAGLDWFAGMAPGPARELSAAAAGEEALEAVLAADDAFDPEVFTPGDHARLDGSWSWLLEVVRAATRDGATGFVADDVAAMRPWGFRIEEIAVPVLVVHGEADRMVPVAHGAWLADRIPVAELRTVPGAGHIAVLDVAPAALEWLRAAADAR